MLEKVFDFYFLTLSTNKKVRIFCNVLVFFFFLGTIGCFYFGSSQSSQDNNLIASVFFVIGFILSFLLLFLAITTGMVSGEQMAIEELSSVGEDPGIRRFLHLQRGCASCNKLDLDPKKINDEKHPIDECSRFQSEFPEP